MQKYFNKFKSINSEQFVLPIITLFISIYVSVARPTLPNFVIKLFENPIFRLIIISYIVYRDNNNNDYVLSLFVASVFLITIHMINKQKIKKISNDFEKK